MKALAPARCTSSPIASPLDGYLVRQSDSNSACKRMILITVTHRMCEMYAQSYAQIAPLTPTLGPQTIIAVSNAPT